MSVLIKGMEMPTSCGLGGADGCGCPCFCAYNEQCQLLRRRIDTAFIKGTPLPSDCPLVPVPPHGDLIDRNNAEAIAYMEEDVGRDFADGILFAADWIRQRPTIIPAEEGE